MVLSESVGGRAVPHVWLVSEREDLSETSVSYGMHGVKARCWGWPAVFGDCRTTGRASCGMTADGTVGGKARECCMG